MKKLLEYSALMYAFLIFIGYSYLDTYYRFFNIPIYSFLDASEILLSFMRNINYFILASVLVGFAFLIMTFVIERTKYEPIDKDSLEFKNTKEKILTILYIIGILSFSIFSIVSLVIDFVDNPDLAFLLLSHIILIIFTIYTFLKLPKFLAKKNIVIAKNTLQVYMIIAFVCPFNYLNAIVDYMIITEKIELTDFSFEYENKNYKSSDTLIFLGLTSQYIFLKNFHSEKSYIFEKGKMSNLVLSKKYRPRPQVKIGIVQDNL